MTSVLFVCLGNICRSPLAEGTFAHLAEEASLLSKFTFDSAGNGDWHEGNPPDPRAISIAARNGIDISNQRSRPVRRSDFNRFDLILCMDQGNLDRLEDIRPDSVTANIDLFLHQAHGTIAGVPDPYYGGDDGFQRVFDQIMKANQALVEKLK